MAATRRLDAVSRQLISWSAVSGEVEGEVEGENWGGDWGENYSFTHPKHELYNTCKAKLLAGEQVFSYTMNAMDVELYLELRKHYDFICARARPTNPNLPPQPPTHARQRLPRLLPLLLLPVRDGDAALHHDLCRG